MSPTSPRVLPVPGLVLGSYPEKEFAGGAHPLWAAAMCAFEQWPPVAAARRRKLDEQLRRVRAALDDAPSPDSDDFHARLHEVRSGMAAMGLRSAAMQQCMGLVLAVIRHKTGRMLRDPQIVAALVAIRGDLAELPTGEGKTLALALAAATAALAGVPVHAITSNDYLARRDAHDLRPVYEALGLRVAAVEAATDRPERERAYTGNVVYVSARELAFDYLRDQLPGLGGAGARRLMPGLCMALIDEADSVLLDEALTPLVLSAPAAAGDRYAPYRLALRLAAQMREGEDFLPGLRGEPCRLTPTGREKAAQCALAGGDGLWRLARYRDELVELALHALHVLQRDTHYIVQAGRVRLIDANTGRIAQGRVLSLGLQQLVEIKEGCDLSAGTETLRQTTFQRLFGRYLHVGGMSGTLFEARVELLRSYGLRVVRVPAAQTSRLVQLPSRVFVSAQARWKAVLEDVASRHACGQPVLVGTESVMQSERLAAMLKQQGLAHVVLNARHDQDEAARVAAAGQRGAITVSTNMAGRGTDIAVSDEAMALGGLHVLSCQCNGSARIDRQLIGRCARHGQPGSAQTLLSLEEGLLGRCVGARWRRLATRAVGPDGALPQWMSALAVRMVRVLEERRGRHVRRELEQAEQRQPFLVRAEVH
jgi:preprotein translocase subunit SecA